MLGLSLMSKAMSLNSRKNVAAIVAVSLVLGIMIGLSVQASDAQLTQPRLGAKTPKSFGAATSGIVCGDRLCSEANNVMDIEETHTIAEIDRNDPSAPSAKLIQIAKFRESTNNQEAITYKITYRLTAGSDNLRNIQIHAKTDVGEWNFEVESLNALKSSVNVARVKALDPDSITGEIVGYEISGPTSSGPAGTGPR